MSDSEAIFYIILGAVVLVFGFIGLLACFSDGPNTGVTRTIVRADTVLHVPMITIGNPASVMKTITMTGMTTGMTEYEMSRNFKVLYLLGGY